MIKGKAVVASRRRATGREENLRAAKVLKKKLPRSGLISTGGQGTTNQFLGLESVDWGTFRVYS